MMKYVLSLRLFLTYPCLKGGFKVVGEEKVVTVTKIVRTKLNLPNGVLNLFMLNYFTIAETGQN